MNEIKNIIFDLGGVIYHIEPERTIDAFNARGAAVAEDIFNGLPAKEVLDRIGTGKMEPREFFGLVKERYPQISDEEIIKCWNALLIGIPKENVELLQQLRQPYSLFLLSNTNAFHVEAINKYLHKEYDVQGLQQWFDKVYFSHEMGLEKPDAAIYEAIILENNLKPEETLFIDDSQKNVEAAEVVGLKSVRHPLNAPLDYLKSFLENN